MTHSDVWPYSCVCTIAHLYAEVRDSCVCVPWLLQTCDWSACASVPWLISHEKVRDDMCAMTRFYVCYDSMICVPWLDDVWHDLTSAVTWWYVCHDSIICVSWLDYMCVMTRWYVCHDSIIRVTRLNQMSTETHLAPRLAHTCVWSFCENKTEAILRFKHCEIRVLTIYSRFSQRRDSKWKKTNLEIENFQVLFSVWNVWKTIHVFILLCTCTVTHTYKKCSDHRYGVATCSRLHQITGLFCRVSSLL